MNKYGFFIEKEKYSVDFKILKDSLIIRIIKDDINNINSTYEKEYFFEEIYEKNENYKKCENTDELLNLIYNDFFLTKEKEVKIESNCMIIKNITFNTEINFEIIKYNEDEVFNDIFLKLSTLIF